MSSAALVTGASSGLGLELAKLLAADRHDLVLVARRRDRLETLAAQLRSQHGIAAHVVVADLAEPGAAEAIAREVERLCLEVEILVNNAGFGTNGAFVELDPARELELVQVNVGALVALTRTFLPDMVARRRGRVLNIASAAAFQPGPFMASYYASKAFVLSFTEALWFELKGTGVTATVSCPGAVATEFGEVSGNADSRLFRLGAADAPTVARQAYRAMSAGKPLIVHGVKNKLAAFGIRFSPRAATRAVAASLNRRPA